MIDNYRLQYSYYPEGTGTDIVPLAALYSGANYFYSKNFGTVVTGGSNTWTIPFGSNINVTDSTKLSFMLAADLGGPVVGGVYNYTSTANNVKIDYCSAANKRGVVMFGPRSFYTGDESGLPKIVAQIANYDGNRTSAAQIQDGVTITAQTDYNHWAKFNTPLTSNLYGVYGLITDSGPILRSYSLTNTGFNFNVMNNNNVITNNANYSLVVVQ
jgi:hypothetical protein